VARVSITDVISNEVLAQPAIDVSPAPRSPRQCETQALPFARQSSAIAVSDADAGAVGGSALAFCAVAVAPPHASEPREAETSIELVVRSASRRFMRRSYTAGEACAEGVWPAIGGIVGVIQQIGGSSRALPNLAGGRVDRCRTSRERAGTPNAQLPRVTKLLLPIVGRPVPRRSVLAWMGATGAASALGSLGCSVSPARPTAAPAPLPVPAAAPLAPYFTAEERAVLGVLADAVLPPDDVPGGNDLGAVDYIEKLLTAFDGETPLIYLGGPFSGRDPLPSDDGTASTSFPSNEFSSFLPLDRVAERAWRLYLYGSSGVPGGGPNDHVTGPGTGPVCYGGAGVVGGGVNDAAATGPGTGPVLGLRDAVANAIKQAQAALPSGVAVTALTTDQAAGVLAALDAQTQSTIIQLVLEGCFTAPEYGGNTNLAGWGLCNFEGDSQPYGYSTYDERTGMYVDHATHPCASPDPGPDPMPMDESTELLIGLAVTVLGGKTF
jgi:hypothetical protein